MSQRKLAACALAATVFVGSGCGASSKSTSSSKTVSSTAAATASVNTTPATLAVGKPLTRTQLIARADPICASTNLQVGTMSARTGSESLRILPQIVVYYSTEAESLGKLVPPRSLAHDWGQIVNDIQHYSQITNAAVRYAKENQLPTARRLYRQAIKLLEQWPATAKRDSFKHCSKLR